MSPILVNKPCQLRTRLSVAKGAAYVHTVRVPGCTGHTHRSRSRNNIVKTMAICLRSGEGATLLAKGTYGTTVPKANSRI